MASSDDGSRFLERRLKRLEREVEDERRARFLRALSAGLPKHIRDRALLEGIVDDVGRVVELDRGAH